MAGEPTKELDTLFEFARPESIQKSLYAALFSYLMNIDKNTVPDDFKEVVSDFYYLTDFVQIEIDNRGQQ